MAAKEQCGVEELYKNFGVLADAGEKAGEVGSGLVSVCDSG